MYCYTVLLYYPFHARFIALAYFTPDFSGSTELDVFVHLSSGAGSSATIADLNHSVAWAAMILYMTLFRIWYNYKSR